MKLFFSLVLKGDDSLEKKFHAAIEENPVLQAEFMRAFGQIVLLALRLKEEDKVSIENFKAGILPEEPTMLTEDEQEKVDN